MFGTELILWFNAEPVWSASVAWCREFVFFFLIMYTIQLTKIPVTVAYLSVTFCFLQNVIILFPFLAGLVHNIIRTV